MAGRNWLEAAQMLNIIRERSIDKFVERDWRKVTVKIPWAAHFLAKKFTRMQPTARKLSINNSWDVIRDPCSRNGHPIPHYSGLRSCFITPNTVYTSPLFFVILVKITRAYTVHINGWCAITVSHCNGPSCWAFMCQQMVNKSLQFWQPKATSPCWEYRPQACPSMPFPMTALFTGEIQTPVSTRFLELTWVHNYRLPREYYSNSTLVR